MEALIHTDKHSVVYGRKTIGFSLFYCDRKTMELLCILTVQFLSKRPCNLTSH